MVVNGKEVKVGEVTANRILAECKSDKDACTLVTAAYASYYGELAPVRLAEQAQLLWMQRTEHPTDVFAVGAPLSHAALFVEVLEISNRIKAAKEINDLANSTQDNTG